jgi:hypothetical protein
MTLKEMPMLETLMGAALSTALTAIGFVIHLGTRVSVLEANYLTVEKRLDKMDAKLDTIIEKLGGQRH